VENIKFKGGYSLLRSILMNSSIFFRKHECDNSRTLSNKLKPL